MKKNQGITMVALVITIALLLILAGISLNTGNKIIQRSNLENLKTNMLLIKVKAKEYVENSNFCLGTSFEKLTDENEKNKRIETAKTKLKGTEIKNINDLSSNFGITSEEFEENRTNLKFYYKLSEQDLVDIGITNSEGNKISGEYIIMYDIENMKTNIYNTDGFEDNGKKYYSLNEIENLEI